MRQLSGTDSAFLSFETPTTPMHVGGLVTLDTRDAPNFGFDSVRELFATRIGRVPMFAWRIEEVPLQLGRPYWTDGDFEVDRHVQRITVPAPGGPRQIAAVIGDQLFGVLDRSVPLWRVWYLDGLPQGTGALYSTYHHCLMDGVSGASISNLLFDLEPNPAADAPVAVEGPGGRDASDLEHVLGAALNVLCTPVTAARFAMAAVRRIGDMAPELVRNGVPEALLSFAPRTSFNHAVGSRRAVSFVSVSLDDVRALRTQAGVTINDLLVALCAGAVRRYLREIGEPLPDRPLSIAVPVSMRATDDHEFTNRVSAVMVSVATDDRDPIECLRAISRQTYKGKRLADTFKKRRLPSIGDLAPPLALGGLTRAVTPFARWMPVLGNTIVSTVRGAPIPLYIAGARVTGTYPSSVVMLNMGLNFTAVSSPTSVDIGVTVDPDLVPDPWLVADGVPDTLAALMLAAGLGDPHPVPVLLAA